jgi:hypothetical protein
MVLVAIVASLMIGLVMYFSFRGFSTTVEFSKSEIQDRVENFVEDNGKIGETIAFSNPVVLLEEEGNRVGLKVDVWASAYGREGTGTLAATGTLTYRPEEWTFYLSDLKIYEISLDGVPKYVMGMVTSYVQDGLNRLIPSIAVYTFKDDSLKQNAAKLVLRTVEVKPGKVVATIGY